MIGSVNVLNAAVRAETVERFVFTTSIAVYGPAQAPMTEDVVPEPEDPYGIAKYAVELDLAAAQRMFGLDYTSSGRTTSTASSRTSPTRTGT